MSNYHNVLAEVGLRINAIEGATAPTLNTNYTTRPLTTTQWRSARFPFASAKDAILNAEGLLGQAVADTNHHPWRKYLLATSSNLASGDNLPTTISGKNVIGVVGDVRDSSSARRLTEATYQEILRKSNAFFTRAVYFYTVTASRKIYHTRTNVVVDLCTYLRTTQATAYDSNGSYLFPDLAEPLYVAGALMLLTRDGRFEGQAATYGAYFQSALQAISQGLTSFAPLPEPATVRANA